MHMNISIDFHFLENLYYRFRNGLGCCDTFNYNSYISKKIANDLKIFKKRNGAYPNNMTFEEWSNIIQKIIDGMEALEKVDMLKDKDWIKKEKQAYKQQKQAFKLFAKYINEFWY